MPEVPGLCGGAAPPSFDLTSRPWIGVLRQDGSQDELSLQQVFAEAGSLRRVVGDLATQEFALLRLLLAIVHDALGGPGDTERWGELWSDLACLAPVRTYLESHRERFDLLHPERPFFQTATLRTSKDEVFSLNRIVADVPNGDPFFTARMPTVERLTFAEAARWVVHAHAYDTSGIKTGAVDDDRARGGKVYPLGTGWSGSLGGVFAEGNSLRETLLLNLVTADTQALDIDADDRPAWRRDPCGPGSIGRVPTGPRDLYTWQTRRVRLHHDTDGVHGVVLGYGDALTARNMLRREPMTAWRRSRAQEKKLGQMPVYLPREHDPTRSAWRGVAALVGGHAGGVQGAEAAESLRPGVFEHIARLVTERHLPRGFLVRARVIGARYGTQQSVVDEVVDDYLAMPVVLLHQQDRVCAVQAIGAAEDADHAVRALGGLAADLARAAGREQEGPEAAARAVGFDALEHPYRSWLSRLAQAEDPFAHRRLWRREVHRALRRLGSDLVTAAGDAAWQGRVVTGKDTKSTYWLSDGSADKWFRMRLAKALGDVTDTSDAPSGTTRPDSGLPGQQGPDRAAGADGRTPNDREALA